MIECSLFCYRTALFALFELQLSSLNCNYRVPWQLKVHFQLLKFRPGSRQCENRKIQFKIFESRTNTGQICEPNRGKDVNLNEKSTRLLYFI